MCGFDRVKADGAMATICVNQGATHGGIVAERADYVNDLSLACSCSILSMRNASRCLVAQNLQQGALRINSRSGMETDPAIAKHAQQMKERLGEVNGGSSATEPRQKK